jgi:hypothetical protein
MAHLAAVLSRAARRGRSRRVSVLLAAFVACVLAFAIGARGWAGLAPAPTSQLSDRLQTVAHEELAGLFDTRLEGGGNELSWSISRLPCRHRQYRLLASEAAITDAYSSSIEVEITIGSERLSSGLRCGSTLPAGVHEDQASLTILPLGVGATRQPSSVYEDSETTIKSFVACVTLAATCPGRYVLRVSLDAPGRRRLALEYRLTVAFVARDQARHGKRDRAAGRTGAIERARQCPIA